VVSMPRLSAPSLTSEDAVAPRRPSATYVTNLVTILLGTWFTLGLFLDAWAHNNLAELETFFTPWHGVFYSGFVATAGWIAWTVNGTPRSGRPVLQSIPAGYGAALIAMVGFAIAAVGDMIWHLVFGIEQFINILFSPTHLGLIAAMFVIVATPLRASWLDQSLPAAPGLRRLLPAVLSASLATTLVLLFVQYANALTFSNDSVVRAFTTLDEELTIRLVSSLAVTNLLLILPLLTLLRRWTLPFGTATILYATVGALSGATTGFGNIDMIVGLLLAGVCVDALARWLRPLPQRPTRLRVFATLAPLVTWTIYVVTAYLFAPDALPAASGALPAASEAQPEVLVELYTGAPIVQALIGLLMSFLLVPGGLPVAAPEPAPTP
jgi:hypothetical protein